MVLMSSQRRAESVEQFCRIHSLRSVTTCGEDELALRDSALTLLPGTPRLRRPLVGGQGGGGTWSFRLRPVCSFPAVSPMSSWGWREACSWGLPAHSPVGLAQAAALPPWPMTLPPCPGVPQICPVSAISTDASCSEVPVMKRTEWWCLCSKWPQARQRGEG